MNIIFLLNFSSVWPIFCAKKHLRCIYCGFCISKWLLNFVFARLLTIVVLENAATMRCTYFYLFFWRFWLKMLNRFVTLWKFLLRQVNLFIWNVWIYRLTIDLSRKITKIVFNQQRGACYKPSTSPHSYVVFLPLPTKAQNRTNFLDRYPTRFKSSMSDTRSFYLVRPYSIPE